MVIAPPTFVVVDTRYVVPPRRWNEPPYLEIVAGQSLEPDAARVTLICRDADLIAHVLQLEGTEQRVGLTWRTEPAPSRRRHVLEAIR
jgi:hypothetical protein